MSVLLRQTLPAPAYITIQNPYHVWIWGLGWGLGGEVGCSENFYISLAPL